MSFLPPTIRRRTTLIALSVAFGLLGFDASDAKAGVIFGFDGEVKAKSTTGRHARPVQPSSIPPMEAETEVEGGGGETGDNASDLNLRRPQKHSGAAGGGSGGTGSAKRGGAGAPGGGAGAGGGGGSGSKSRSSAKPATSGAKNNDAANGERTAPKGDETTTKDGSENSDGATSVNGAAASRHLSSPLGSSGSGDFFPGLSASIGSVENMFASGFPGVSSFAGQGRFSGDRVPGAPASGSFDCPLPVDWLSCYPALTAPAGCAADDPPPPIVPVVPEPSTALLMTLGLAAAGWRWRLATPRI